MTDFVVTIQEEQPIYVIRTIEQTPVIEVPQNSNITSVSSLSDVNISSVQEGDVLTFDSGTWRNRKITDSSIQSSLDGGEFF